MDEFATIPTGARAAVESFVLNVPDEDIAGFKLLLRLSKIAPKTYENKLHKFGATRDWLVQAKDEWLNHFDWRAYERRINAYPNFKATITDSIHGDLTVHFAALFSKRLDAVPIIFMHGWPGCFLEFQPMLALLKGKYTPETLPYHVVVPSLPGYALSDGPPLDQDFHLADIARIMNQLMVDLGFGVAGYIAQGGDIGSGVARMLATNKECKAIHVNYLDPSSEQPSPSSMDVTEQEQAHLERTNNWRQNSMAYAFEHATRPGTIGLVLASSPLALLAWIGEKYLEWVDKTTPLGLETILGFVSLYWFTNSLPRCLYPYRDMGIKYPDLGSTAFGYSYFPAEMVCSPAAWCKAWCPDMVRYRHDKGGHFAALEVPELFLKDVEDFVDKCAHLIK